MRTKNSRVPLVLTLSMLMLFHIPRQCLCAYVRVCIPNTYLTQFFLNHLKIETSCPFTSKYISTYFLRTKTFSHITTLQLSTLGNQRSCTIWSTDALRIWPVVPAVPFIGKKKKNNPGPVVFLCHVSFVSFNLRTALQCVLLFHDTDASEERGAFRRLASVWFRLMSPHD